MKYFPRSCARELRHCYVISRYRAVTPIIRLLISSSPEQLQRNRKRSILHRGEERHCFPEKVVTMPNVIYVLEQFATTQQ